jgi:hypothetical protein
MRGAKTMSLASVTLEETIGAEESARAEPAALASANDWLWLMWGLRPGVSYPRCTPGPVHPSCMTTAGWLRALWGADG